MDVSLQLQAKVASKAIISASPIFYSAAGLDITGTDDVARKPNPSAGEHCQQGPSE